MGKPRGNIARIIETKRGKENMFQNLRVGKHFCIPTWTARFHGRHETFGKTFGDQILPHVSSASQNTVLMMKFVINCMLNIQTQHKFKYAHQQILFFKLLFNVKLIYTIQVIGPWLEGKWPFFFFSGGAE